MSLTSDSAGSQAAIALSQLREKVAALGAIFLYEKCPLDITPEDLRLVEQELRGILKEICLSPDIRDLLGPIEKAQDTFQETMKKIVCAVSLAQNLEGLEKLRNSYDEKLRHCGNESCIALEDFRAIHDTIHAASKIICDAYIEIRILIQSVEDCLQAED